MATKTLPSRFAPVAYRPTPEEIAEKTAVFRERKLKQKREEFDKQDYDQQRRSEMREMTKADICNVELASDDELFDALRMITKAAGSMAFTDSSRWSIVDGKEVI